MGKGGDPLDEFDLELELPADFDFAGERADTSAAEGTFFGPYQVIADVGRGGVARVMRARHIHPNYADSTFALKVLHDEFALDERVVSFFRNEALILSMLKHPNIVQTFEAGTQEDKIFIAMEYIDGRDFDAMIARCQRFNIELPMPVAMFVICEVLAALDYAHELSDADGKPLHLVHRDINPSNVFLSYDGQVKLGDFGVVSFAAESMERSRELAGKIGYFAPEQLAGGKVDQRADLFSLGVMMFEVFTGRRLFDGSNDNEAMRLNRRARVPKPSRLNPDIPPGLEAVILRALERRPIDRFQSARQMREALIPFVPDLVGMPLAVASLIRMVFLQEHIQELQLREGLKGQATARGSGQNVTIFTSDQRARVAFCELLSSRGYRVSHFDDVRTFRLACAQGSEPDVLLLGIADAALVMAELTAVLASLQSSAPVIGVCDTLDASVCAMATDFGAVDLLSKPFNIERVLTSVRAALSGGAHALVLEADVVAEPCAMRTKVVIVSSDPGNAMRLSQGLAEHGFIVNVSPTAAEALIRSDEVSYNAVVFDVGRNPELGWRFAEQFRSRPGMGFVPMVYLADARAKPDVQDRGAERSSFLPKNAPAGQVVDALNRVVADTQWGRSFIRYQAHFGVELRFGGRAFIGEAVNISRGGVMFSCDQLPPIGDTVSVGLHLPHSSQILEATGSVIRVDRARHGYEGEQPRIGVAFQSFAGRGEADLIDYLARLDGDIERRQKMGLGGSVAGR